MMWTNYPRLNLQQAFSRYGTEADRFAGRKSSTFRLTGGVHGAALADSKTCLSCMRILVDIMRLTESSAILFDQINNADKILLLSGRVSRNTD